MTDFDPAVLRRQYHQHSRVEYEALLGSIVEEIRTLLAGRSLRFQIKHRVKDFEEYFKKLAVGPDGRPAVEQINDLMGVRIVCPFLEDLDEVERILSAHFDITEVDKKHRSQSFREFGYDSTHLLLVLGERQMAHPLPFSSLVCEVQLRTILQDAWAEVEHALIYKSEWPIPTFQIRRKLAALNANLALGDIIFQELREFQREMLRKQSRRRSLTDDSIAMLAESEIHTKLFAGDENPSTRDNLEKVIIEALSAHAEEAYETAIELYTRALQMPGVDAVRSILRNHRGMAHLALGHVDASHEEFSAAIAADPANYRAWYNLGAVRKSLGKRAGAAEAFEICLRLNPTFAEARVKQVHLFLDSSDLEKAEQALIELRRYSPDSSELPALEKALAACRTPGDDTP